MKSISSNMKNDLILKTKPWAHQLTALDFLFDRNAAALYTDMGTGKSKVIIDLIMNKGFKRVLIVVTNKGCDVWERQFAIHSNLPQNRVVNLHGKSTQVRLGMMRNARLESSNSDPKLPIVVLINYEGVWRKPLSDYLRLKFNFDCVICDESHRIKSPGSKVSRYLALLGSKTPYRYLVTGTPLAESPLDVYAQYRFLAPWIFGTNYRNFASRYEVLDPILSARIGHPIRDKKNPYKNLDELRKKFYSIAFKAESSLVLPKQLNIIRQFTLNDKTQAAYKELQEEGVLLMKSGELEITNVLTMSLRLQQISSGYIPVETEDKQKRIVNTDSGRADVLEDILDGLPKSEPVVVFARFRPDLTRIRRLCDRMGLTYAELSGKVDTEAEWQSGKAQVLGVQYTSGSESVDFTRARYCVYYSLTNSLALYEQSKKRIHRPGQTRSVMYYHIIADITKGASIDRIILKALKNKRDVVEYIMEQGL